MKHMFQIVSSCKHFQKLDFKLILLWNFFNQELYFKSQFQKFRMQLLLILFQDTLRKSSSLTERNSKTGKINSVCIYANKNTANFGERWTFLPAKLLYSGNVTGIKIVAFKLCVHRVKEWKINNNKKHHHHHNTSLKYQRASITCMFVSSFPPATKCVSMRECVPVCAWVNECCSGNKLRTCVSQELKMLLIECVEQR